MQYLELLNLGVEVLIRAGVANAELDARLLLEAVTRKSRTELYLEAQKNVGQSEHGKYLEFIAQRKRREPVAYILGEKEFWSLSFSVNPDVLIPRPETEFLLEKVLNTAEKHNCVHGSILDLCCGSGVIAVVLAKEIGEKVVAADISSGALRVAQQNIYRHKVGDRVSLVQGDLLKPFARSFSLIVSNPPYVSQHAIAQELEPEVAKYEPHLALDGGEHGIDIVNRIYNQLDGALLPGGHLFMEIGADQGEWVMDLLASGRRGKITFQHVEIFKDYSGRDRVVYAQRNK